MTNPPEFWRGDVVRVTSTDPGREYENGLWLIEYPPQEGDTRVSVVSSLYGGYSQFMVELDRIELVDRGNHYRLHHGRPLSFDDIAQEASFWVELKLMQAVPYDFGRLFVWPVEQVLAALESGEVDAAFWVTGPHFPNGDASPTLNAYMCLLPEVAARMRAASLEFLLTP